MNEKEKEKEFYTVNELAEKLPISRLSVYKALKRGDIHSVRIGKKIIIPAESFKKVFQD